MTTYAYLTHPAVAGTTAGWGVEWLRSGGAEVRFRAAVLDGDPIDCVPVQGDDGWTIEARVGPQVRAEMAVWAHGAPWPMRDGDPLESVEVALDDRWSDYAARAGDDLALYGESGLVHPVAWLRMANDVFHSQLVTGPWIHTRSRVQHLGLAHIGGIARVDATVVRRFRTSAGARAVADVEISVDGVPMVMIEHEALVALG